MKNKSLLLALSLTLAACAAEGVDDPSVLASDAPYDDEADVDSTEQALCAGPPASYILAGVSNVGSWNGANPQFDLYSYNTGTGEALYSAAYTSLSRTVAGPCTSLNATQWQCGPGGGVTYTCPAVNQVAMPYYVAWSDTSGPYTVGNKSNGCGKTWKNSGTGYATGFAFKSTFPAVNSQVSLTCTYYPSFIPLKAL